MISKNITELINESFAIEEKDAKEAGTVGYMARALVQATMPHSKPKDPIFVRENGGFTMALFGNPKVGLPYGSVPRLVLSWLTTEAVRTKERQIILGNNLSDFMRELDLVPTGGRWGTITRLRDQMTRLFGSTISCSYTDERLHNGQNLIAGGNLQIAEKYNVWWTPKSPDEISLFESTVLLSQQFFNEVTQNPVPIDQRALKILRKSPMALDQYCWLTYRMFSLKKPTLIPWNALQMQFGAEYSRDRDFKAAFLKQMKKVHMVYPEAKVEEDLKGIGLLLRPSPTHVAPRINGRAPTPPTPPLPEGRK